MKRNQFSRDSSFAVHLVLATLSASLIFMIIAAAITFAPAVLQLEFGSDSLDQITALTQRILEIHAVVWPVVMVCLITVTITSLFLFNRMTEPLGRFVKAFENIRQGKFPDPIQLRARDYLKREAKALNEMTIGLGLLIGEVKRRQIDLSNTIEEIAGTFSPDHPEQIAELVNSLGEQEKSLRESIDRFSDPA